MGLFDHKSQSKKEKPVKEMAGQMPTAANSVGSRPFKGTYVGPNMVLEGTTKGEEDILVEGQIHGELNCSQHVIVGRSGVIKADVKCRSITIQGEMFGNLDASDTLTIEATGKLVGDIRTKTFINQPGGFFQGVSKMVFENRMEKPASTGKPNESKAELPDKTKKK